MALGLVFTTAAAYLGLRVAHALAGVAVPSGRLVATLALMGVAFLLLYALANAVRRRPTWMEAAQRLDLEAGRHNRVAIALALLHDPDERPFAAAAICDGIDQLRRIAHERPALDAWTVPWRRFVGLASAASVLVVLGLLLPPLGHGPPMMHRPEAPTVADLAATPRPTAAPPVRMPEPVVAPASRPQGASRESGRAAGRKAQPLRVPDRPALAGNSGRGAAAEASDVDYAAGGQGESTGSPSESPRPDRSIRPTKRSPSRQSRIADRRRSEETQPDDSTVSRGGAGGGTMLPVVNTWSRRAETTENQPTEDRDADEDIEDENEANRQRGGVQPTLKDRNEAPSRELGISGDQGPPGAGRGGPTPPKKSRGTASLVLGVPVPDFVKGRLGPGTTKVTHERIRPAPMEGTPATGSPATPPSGPEAPAHRRDVPAPVARLVRDYLIALHSADAVARTPAGAPASQATAAR